MKELTVIFASLFLLSVSGPAQTAANNWMSFIVQAEGRPAANTAWERAQRLEVSKRVGVAAGQGDVAGAISLQPEDKEVRFTFSNFTMNGAWFTPGQISVTYQEDGRVMGPVRALPGPENSDYFQMTLRFREKTVQSLLSIQISGRVAGRSVKDTVNTILQWGSVNAKTPDVQVSYLDNYDSGLAVKSPYAGAPSSYGASQGRLEAGSGAYAVQLGAYNIVPDGRQFSAAAAFGTVYSRRIGNQYYVRVGPYNDPALAKQYLERIRTAFPEAYIVLEDNTVPLSAAPAQSPYSNTNPYGQPSQYGEVAAPRLPATTPQAAPYELPAGITGYAIQLASYTREDNAVAFAGRLKEKGLSDVYVWKKDGNNRVVIAPFPNKGGAASYLETLKRQYSQDGIVTYIE